MASNNQLQDLEGIEEMQRLHSIDISYNIIQTLEDIYFASDATFLNDFASLGNPMEQVLYCIPYYCYGICVRSQKMLGEHYHQLSAARHDNG